MRNLIGVGIGGLLEGFNPECFGEIKRKGYHANMAVEFVYNKLLRMPITLNQSPTYPIPSYTLTSPHLMMIADLKIKQTCLLSWH